MLIIRFTYTCYNEAWWRNGIRVLDYSEIVHCVIVY